VDEAAKMRVVADKIGCASTLFSTAEAEFNSLDKNEVERTFAETRRRCAQPRRSARTPSCWCRAGLAAAAARGNPAEGPALAMPRAWEFQIEFNSTNGHLTRSGLRDNTPSPITSRRTTTRRYVSRVGQAADSAGREDEGVVAPKRQQQLQGHAGDLPAFRPIVPESVGQGEHDIGNHVRFAPPENWILTLNELIAKVHVKD
jgi:hexulose-6-phosphate isomerase